MNITGDRQSKAAARRKAKPTSRYQCGGAVSHGSHVVGVMLKWLRPHPLLLAAAGRHRDQLKMEHCPLGCAHHKTVFLLRKEIIKEVHLSKTRPSVKIRFSAQKAYGGKRPEFGDGRLQGSFFLQELTIPWIGNNTPPTDKINMKYFKLKNAFI